MQVKTLVRNTNLKMGYMISYVIHKLRNTSAISHWKYDTESHDKYHNKIVGDVFLARLVISAGEEAEKILLISLGVH